MNVRDRQNGLKALDFAKGNKTKAVLRKATTIDIKVREAEERRRGQGKNYLVIRSANT